MGVCILGMGDCNSSTSVDISNITNNDTNINNSVRNNIEQNCNAASIQENTANIIGSNVEKLSAMQKNSIENTCILQSILTSNVSADVTNALLAKVKENLETKGGLLGSPASNNSVVENITTNKTNIDNSTFNNISKNCILNTKQANLLNIIGSNIEDSNIDQANAAFLKCLSTHSNDTKVTAAALADTKNEGDVTAKATGGDVLVSAGSLSDSILKGLNSIAGTYMWAIVAICIVFLLSSCTVSILAMMSPPGGGASQFASVLKNPEFLNTVSKMASKN